jgi:hypothetical protein
MPDRLQLALTLKEDGSLAFVKAYNTIGIISHQECLFNADFSGQTKANASKKYSLLKLS